MGTTTILYKRGAVMTTSVERKYVRHNDTYACQKTVVQAYPPAQTSRSVQNSESRTYTRGDHVHSTPFTGYYIEQSPMVGNFLTTYYQRSSDSTHCVGAGNTSVCQTDFGFYVENPVAPVVYDDAEITQRLRDAANTKALADLNRSYYSMGVILAERMKTIDYIVSKTKQLIVLLKHRSTADLTKFLQSRKSDRRRIAKDLAGEHLGFIFGLLPLIDEISGLADLLASSETAVITGRGRRALQTDNKTVSTDIRYGADYPRALLVTTDTMVKRSVRTSVSMEITIAAFQRMRDHGLNPVATFYDIVPLSFLSDFISNTGAFLRSYDPLVGLSFMTGNSTVWLESTVTTTVRGITATTEDGSPSGLTVTSSGDGYARSRYLRVKRDPLTELPEAIWQFQNNLTLAKAATLASLAIQRSFKPVAHLNKVLRNFRYKGPRPKYLPPIKYQKVI